MSNFILDASAIEAVYFSESKNSDITDYLTAIEIAKSSQWLYMGELSEILSRLLLVDKEAYKLNSNDTCDTSDHLKELSDTYNWLASLPGDVTDYSDKDSLAGALSNASIRLGDNSVVVTIDSDRLSRGEPFVDFQMALGKINKYQIDFFDLKTQQNRIRSRLETALHTVLHHGRYVMGPEVEELEKSLAQYVDVEYSIAVSNGTDALMIAMMAIGIEPGDEIITTPFTFMATIEMITALGAKPVYVDIDPRTFNIDTGMIEQAITTNSRAILPVNLYGQCADMDCISEIASRNGLYVIEDAAQSFGATYKNRFSCSLGDIACTSFYPTKPLGAYGDAGACFTHDPEIANVMRQIRDHGQDRRYHHVRAGVNGRMDSLQAAVLLAKLEVFDDELEKRNQVAGRYTELIEESKSGGVILPYVEDHNTSSWAQYTIQVAERESVQNRIAACEIPTMVHYPSTTYRQPVALQEGIEFLNSERASEAVLSLPMHPYLGSEQQKSIINSLLVAIKD